MCVWRNNAAYGPLRWDLSETRLFQTILLQRTHVADLRAHQKGGDLVLRLSGNLSRGGGEELRFGVAWKRAFWYNGYNPTRLLSIWGLTGKVTVSAPYSSVQSL